MLVHHIGNMQIVADHTFGSQVRVWKQMKPRITRHCYNQNLGTNAMSTAYPVTWHHWKLHRIDRELCCFKHFFFKWRFDFWCLQHVILVCSLLDLLAFCWMFSFRNQFGCFVAWLGWVEPLCKTTWRTGLQKETIFLLVFGSDIPPSLNNGQELYHCGRFVRAYAVSIGMLRGW